MATKVILLPEPEHKALDLVEVEENTRSNYILNLVIRTEQPRPDLRSLDQIKALQDFLKNKMQKIEVLNKSKIDPEFSSNLIHIINELIENIINANIAAWPGLQKIGCPPEDCLLIKLQL